MAQMIFLRHVVFDIAVQQIGTQHEISWTSARLQGIEATA